MAEELRDIEDDVSNDYLLSRQVAHEYNHPGMQAFINSFSQAMQPTSKETSEFQFKGSQQAKTKGGKVVRPQQMTSEEMAKEVGAQVEEPMLDPVSAAAGGFAGTGKIALDRGMKLMPALGRAMTAGVVGGAADYPIGAATEAVEAEFPALSLPFNVLAGFVSGATLENAIEQGVIKGLGKAADSATIRRFVQDTKNILANEAGQVNVFHGSPHKFDKFTTEKIGTGEGAQAFGWGLYFTDKVDIAESYRRSTPTRNPGKDVKLLKSIKGIPIEEIPENDITSSFITSIAIDDIQGANSNLRWAKKHVNEYIDEYYDLSKDELNRTRKFLDTFPDEINEKDIIRHQGQVYKATLHKGKTPDQYDYLEWDKGVDEKNKRKILKQLAKEETFGKRSKWSKHLKGKESLDSYIKQFPESMKILEFDSGELVYKQLRKEFKTKKAASLFLLRAGIDGIKYPSGTLSGVKETDAFNYVVFDEKAVEMGHAPEVRVTPGEKEGDFSIEETAPSEEQQKSVFKSVVQSLNKVIDNEIGAIGDIDDIRKRLDGVDDIPGELAKIKAEQSQEVSRKVLVSIGRKPETSAKALSVENIGDLELKDKAININFRRIEATDDIKKTIQRVSEIYEPEIQEARRGVVSNKETKKLADVLGMTPEQLLKRQKGQPFNAHEALAARRIMVSSAENLHALSQKVKTIEATDSDKYEFRKALNLHYAIQSQVSGMTAEAGRALQQFNIRAASAESKTRQIKEFLTQLPEGVTVEKIADMIGSIDTVEGMNTAVSKMVRSTTKDMFLEAWINGLLSGPHTHAINTLSNSLNAVWQIPERYLAAQIGKITPGEQVIRETEALQQAYGLVQGFKDGLKAFGKVARTGVASDELTKLEAARYKAITAGNVRELPLIKKLAPNALQEGGVSARAVDLLGETVRLPGRFLMAEDELFKAVGYRMELRAQAYRMGTSEGLEGDALAKRMAEIIQNPEEMAPNVHLAAVDAQRYQTFTNPLDSKLLGALSQSKNPVVKMIAPFVRTPTNILKYGFERTPFAFMLKNVRADIQAGGARRDLALARISMGTMLSSLMANMAAEGMITGGGPSDPKLQANLRRQGWQPYSIKIGNKYVKYGRLEPMGMIFGLAADFAEISGLAGEEMTPEIENLASAIVVAVSRNVTSKTFLRGISEAVSAMDDPDRYGNRYIQNYARSMVPAIVAQSERIIDPDLEAIYGISDGMKSRIPGWSKDMPKRRDLWGEPISFQWGTGKRSWAEIAYQTLSPIYISEGKASPIDKELTRLKLGLSKPRRNQRIGNIPMELTPELYDKFILFVNKNSINGRDLKDALNDFIQSSLYSQLSEEKKMEKIRNHMSKATEHGRRKMSEYLEENMPEWDNIKNAWAERLLMEQSQ